MLTHAHQAEGDLLILGKGRRSGRSSAGGPWRRRSASILHAIAPSRHSPASRLCFWPCFRPRGIVSRVRCLRRRVSRDP